MIFRKHLILLVSRWLSHERRSVHVGPTCSDLQISHSTYHIIWDDLFSVLIFSSTTPIIYISVSLSCHVHNFLHKPLRRRTFKNFSCFLLSFHLFTPFSGELLINLYAFLCVFLLLSLSVPNFPFSIFLVLK